MEAHSAVVNKLCGEEHTLRLDNLSGVVLTLEGDHIRLGVQTGSSGILDQFHRFRSHLMNAPYNRKSDATDIDPDGHADITLQCSTVRLYPALEENEYYWIDNDHFEACPVEVRVRYNAINIFQ